MPSIIFFNITAYDVVVSDVATPFTIPASWQMEGLTGSNTELILFQSAVIIDAANRGNIGAYINGGRIDLIQTLKTFEPSGGGGGGTADVNPTANTEVLRDGSAKAKVKGLSIYDPAIASFSAMTYSDTSGSVLVESSIEATGDLMADADALILGRIYVDPSLSLIAAPPAVASFTVNVKKVGGADGIKIYNGSATPVTLQLMVDDGEGGTGAGKIKSMAGVNLVELALEGSPVLVKTPLRSLQSVQEGASDISLPGPYDIGFSERYIIVNQTIAAAITINLPAANSTGNQTRKIAIKDGKGDASLNNITIVPSGVNKIDGATSRVININFGFVELISAFTTVTGTWDWYVV